MTKYFPEGTLFKTSENSSYLKNLSTLTEALHEGRILEASVKLCDASHNLHLDLNGLEGIIPRCEGAIGIKEGVIRDIAIISRVNRPVCFIITGIEQGPCGRPVITASRRLAQERCMHDYINTLVSGDIIGAKVTHLEQFGAFADIGCGIPSLLPIDAISVSRIDHPSRRLRAGMSIKAVVKSCDKGRICLSHKELLGTWQENADLFEQGQTVRGIVRSIEDYGAFIELTPNLAGLSESRPDLKEGMQVSVFIKSIIPQKMKIKLIVIDVFGNEPLPEEPRYFYSGSKIKEFRYSPVGCNKEIITYF